MDVYVGKSCLDLLRCLAARSLAKLLLWLNKLKRVIIIAVRDEVDALAMHRAFDYPSPWSLE